MTKRNNLKGSAILVTAAFIWGLAFVAQNAASKVPPFLLNSLRSFISPIFLYGVFRVTERGKKSYIFPKEPEKLKSVLKGALVCGILLAISVNFQQFGISGYPKGVAVEAHSGFITALYVVIVPVISLFFGKKVPIAVWFAVGVSLVGFYLLCLSGGLDGIYLGDFLVLICAFSFSFHIITVDRFVGEVGGVRLSMLQFIVCGTVSGVLSLIFERDLIVWSEVVAAAPHILYLGILSSGVAYTLQIVGQQYAEPPIASLSMSLESVFAALGGWFAGNVLNFGEAQSLSLKELSGCILVFSAIVLAQLPDLLKKKTEN